MADTQNHARSSKGVSWAVKPTGLPALMLLVISALWLVSCAADHKDDAIVEINGTRYIACGGVVALGGNGNVYDPGTYNKEVLFIDPQGRKYDFKQVHNLIITDLPNGSPACPNHSAPSAAKQ